MPEFLRAAFLPDCISLRSLKWKPGHPLLGTEHGTRGPSLPCLRRITAWPSHANGRAFVFVPPEWL